MDRGSDSRVANRANYLRNTSKKPERAVGLPKSKKSKRSFGVFVEKQLSRVEVYRRRHTSTFEFVAFATAIFFQALYVYTLYVDVRVIQSLMNNGHVIAAGLAIMFITTHYVVLDFLLLWHIKQHLVNQAVGKGSWDDTWSHNALQAEDDKRATGWPHVSPPPSSSKPLVDTHKPPQKRALVWKTLKKQPWYRLILIPPTFFIAFVALLILIPILDLVMIAIEAISYIFESQKDENLAPLQFKVLNFLLQYKNIRLPLQTILQNVPQVILQLILFLHFKDDPSEKGTSGSQESVIQAMSAAALNVIVNTITFYLTLKLSGETLFRYLSLAFQFQGAAALPPEWVERWIGAKLVVDGSYRDLQLAQQMKILQAAVRRDSIALITPSAGYAEPQHWLENDSPLSRDHSGKPKDDSGLPQDDSRLPQGNAQLNSSRSMIVMDNRKMLEFMYDLNGNTMERRLPSKIDQMSQFKDEDNPMIVNINFVRLHDLQDYPPKDPGDKFHISEEQMEAKKASWKTQQLALWLIANPRLVNHLRHVSLVKCDIGAAYIYGHANAVDNPMIMLLQSTSIKTLDLSDNPLFVYTSDASKSYLYTKDIGSGNYEQHVNDADRTHKMYHRTSQKAGRFNQVLSTNTRHYQYPTIPDTTKEDKHTAKQEDMCAVTVFCTALLGRSGQAGQASWHDRGLVSAFLKVVYDISKAVFQDTDELQVSSLAVLRLSQTGLQAAGTARLTESVPGNLRLLDISHNDICGKHSINPLPDHIACGDMQDLNLVMGPAMHRSRNMELDISCTFLDACKVCQNQLNTDCAKAGAHSQAPRPHPCECVECEQRASKAKGSEAGGQASEEQRASEVKESGAGGQASHEGGALRCRCENRKSSSEAKESGAGRQEGQEGGALHCRCRNIKSAIISLGQQLYLTLTKVDLSSNSQLKDKGMEYLGEALKSPSCTITCLVLRSMGITAEGVSTLAEAMKKNTTLTALDLSGNDLSQNERVNGREVPDRGAMSLAKAFEEICTQQAHKKFCKLEISGAFLRASGISILCHVGLSKLTTLTALDLSHNVSTGARRMEIPEFDDTLKVVHEEMLENLAAVRFMAKNIGKVLSFNRGMEHLSLAKMQLDYGAAEELMTYLSTDTPSLKTLDIGHNPLGSEGAELIFSAIQGHTSLCSLCMSATNLTDLNEVLSILEFNKGLHLLDLTRNFIQDVDKVTFKHFNANNKSMHRIDLRWNRVSPEASAFMQKNFSSVFKAENSFTSQIADMFSIDAIYREEEPYQLLV